MRVYAVLSWGDLDLGNMTAIPQAGDTVQIPDGVFIVRKRLFQYEGRLNWYGQIRRTWACRLFFEDNP